MKLRPTAAISTHFRENAYFNYIVSILLPYTGKPFLRDFTRRLLS
jgi:hypothetical protein